MNINQVNQGEKKRILIEKLEKGLPTFIEIPKGWEIFGLQFEEKELLGIIVELFDNENLRIRINSFYVYGSIILNPKNVFLRFLAYDGRTTETKGFVFQVKHPALEMLGKDYFWYIYSTGIYGKDLLDTKAAEMILEGRVVSFNSKKELHRKIRTKEFALLLNHFNKERNKEVREHQALILFELIIKMKQRFDLIPKLLDIISNESVFLIGLLSSVIYWGGPFTDITNKTGDRLLTLVINYMLDRIYYNKGELLTRTIFSVHLSYLIQKLKNIRKPLKETIIKILNKESEPSIIRAFVYIISEVLSKNPQFFDEFQYLIKGIIDSTNVAETKIVLIRVIRKNKLWIVQMKNELIELTNDENLKVRVEASINLITINEKQYLSVLLEMLSTEEPYGELSTTKREALLTIGEMKENAYEAIPILTKLINYKLDDLTGVNLSHVFRNKVDQILIEFGEKAVEDVVKVLQTDEDQRNRFKAAFILGKIESKAVGAIKPLITAFLNDKSSKVRKYAARALCEINIESKEIKLVLLENFKKETNDVRYAIAQGLVKAMDLTTKEQELIFQFICSEEDIEIKKKLVECFDKTKDLDKEIGPKLVKQLYKEDKLVIKTKIARIIGRTELGKEDNDRLLEMLDNSDENDFKQLLIYSLGFTGVNNDQVISKLSGIAQKEQNEDLRWTAIRSLALLGKESKVVHSLLKQLLKEDESEKVRDIIKLELQSFPK